jgi:hypothetical protein
VTDDPGDNELEEELRRIAAQVEPVPPGLIDAAVGAFAWRTIDADLAELVFDSSADQDEAALVRGTGQARMLSFRAGSMTIDVEVTATAESRTLVGQLTPPQEASVDIQQATGMDTVHADELGRFSAGPLRAGPLSLRCHPGARLSQPPVVTDWVTI